LLAAAEPASRHIERGLLGACRLLCWPRPLRTLERFVSSHFPLSSQLRGELAVRECLSGNRKPRPLASASWPKVLSAASSQSSSCETAVKPKHRVFVGCEARRSRPGCDRICLLLLLLCGNDEAFCVSVHLPVNNSSLHFCAFEDRQNWPMRCSLRVFLLRASYLAIGICAAQFRLVFFPQSERFLLEGTRLFTRSS
jgi:hypothetical protein